MKYNQFQTLGILYLSVSVVELEPEKNSITIKGARLRIEEPSRWFKATKSEQDGIGGGNFYKT